MVHFVASCFYTRMNHATWTWLRQRAIHYYIYIRTKYMQTRKEFATTCILKARQVTAQRNTLGMNARINTDNQKSKKKHLVSIRLQINAE